MKNLVLIEPSISIQCYVTPEGVPVSESKSICPLARVPRRVSSRSP